MIMLGEDLIFISQIKRDGSGTIDVSLQDMSLEADEKFEVCSLSVTYNTYIACGFNSYVVKKKIKEKT